MANLHGVDLNLLVALDTLLTERNVSRAADKLCVTQPALSGSLQRLRSHFNDPLLLRVGREMELTPKARALIEPVRAALLQIENVLEVRALFDPATSDRTFRIAMPDCYVCVLLPQLIKRMAAEGPGVGLVLEDVSGSSFNHLEGGEVDLVLAPSDRRLFGREGPDVGLVSQDLFKESLVCVVADEHPVRGPMTLEEYCQYPHVLANFGAGVRTIESMDRARQGISVKGRILVPTFSGMLYQLPGTTLIATVQRRLATPLVQRLGLRMLESPLPLEFQETVIWHVRSEADPGHRWLRNLLLEVGRALE